MNRKQRASQQMKALWADPEFRARRSQAAAARMSLLWSSPAFVDRQLRAMVRSWGNAAHRYRQMSAIRDGRRPAPLATQPPGPACPMAHGSSPCSRRGPHGYHVAVVGTVDDGSLRLVGWVSP